MATERTALGLEHSNISSTSPMQYDNPEVFDVVGVGSPEEYIAQSFADKLAGEGTTLKDQYAEAYEAYAQSRLKEGKTLYEYDEILYNYLLLSDNDRTQMLHRLFADASLETEVENELVSILLSFHNSHVQDKIPPFGLKDYPDIIRTELTTLDDFADKHGVPSNVLRSAYRESVDSGLLGSVEALELVEEKLKIIQQRIKHMESVTHASIGGGIIYYLATHGINEQSVIDMLNPQSSFKGADLICKGILIGGISIPSLIRFTQNKVKNQYEKKKSLLDTHIKNTTIIIERIAKKKNKDGTPFMNTFLGSFELIDELFTDEELEGYAKMFAENEPNKTDIGKLREAFAMEDVDIDTNEGIDASLQGLEGLVTDADEKFREATIERLKNMQASTLYTIFHNIVDNLDHIPGSDEYIQKFLSEIDHLKEEKKTVAEIRSQIPKNIFML